jgi:aminoacrylate hydrolase
MRSLNHHGATLHYELHGAAGEPVLLIQGVGVIGNGWKPQVDGLSASHRLLTFDNRGIGQSTLAKGAPFSIEQMADDARALMDAAGWDSAHVVGHSMGGVIAQRLALTHPKRVRSLALLCTVARGKDAVRMTPQMMWTALRTSLGPKAARRRAFLELIYPKPFLVTADCTALAAELAPLFGHDLATQPPIAMKQAMALRRHDCSGELSAGNSPRSSLARASWKFPTPLTASPSSVRRK